MERQNSCGDRLSPTGTVFISEPKSEKYGNVPTETKLEYVKELWDKLCVLQETLQNLPMHEGLKPLENYASFEELVSLAGESLIHELFTSALQLREMLNSVVPFIDFNGCCKSLNFSMQPVIGVIYGPTGCGKSQLLRNLMSNKLVCPQPETVFFIAPQVDMIPPQEITAWHTQICEGNYCVNKEGLLVPQSGVLMPAFVPLSYDQLLLPQNYDVTHPENIFAAAAAKGPIAIIMDECMEELGSHKGIAKFFHAFPSKLHDKFPKCTGYTVLVVLHNMNPKKDIGGNISNLKIQSKMHIISPKMHPSQLNRFINIYTKGLPLAISLILKDIFNFHCQHGQYDWIIYNTGPVHDALQWMYMSPKEGLMPMYINVQCFLYNVLEKISKTIKNRQRWTRYYTNKRLLN